MGHSFAADRVAVAASWRARTVSAGWVLESLLRKRFPLEQQEELEAARWELGRETSSQLETGSLMGCGEALAETGNGHPH